MSLFKSKEEKQAEKELGGIISRLEMDMSNNYKDNAQADLKELEAAVLELRSSGKLPESTLARFEATLASYQARLKGYSHQDQKPYWTKED